MYSMIENELSYEINLLFSLSLSLVADLTLVFVIHYFEEQLTLFRMVGEGCSPHSQVEQV